MADYGGDAFMRGKDAAVQARTKAQNRATVLQLKLIGQSHPTGLTSNLLKLFEPRPPLEYKPPPEKRKCLPLTGMSQFVSEFAEPGDKEYAPPVVKAETPAERRARIQRQRLEMGALKASEELKNYDPTNDPNVTGDPYKTLFVARLSYETTEHRIKRDFEAYGPIKRVRVVTDKETNKPRGYAFVEYAHTRDMKTAYKQADGRKLDNRRVLVDVERGRTVPNWRPRRLGGGLGSTRVGGEEVNQKFSGREPQQVASSGIRHSEEPRTRDDRHVDRDRELSRERGRDREREREKSRERSHERPRERDSREDRHHKDRDKTKDRERDRDRGRDGDYRSRDREHGRDRERDRDRDRERGHRRSRDRDYEHEDPESEFERPKERRDGEYEQLNEDGEHEMEMVTDRERDFRHPDSSVGHKNSYMPDDSYRYDAHETDHGDGHYNGKSGNRDDGYGHDNDERHERMSYDHYERDQETGYK